MERERAYQEKTKKINAKIMTVEIILLISILTAGIATYWDELHGTQKIEKDMYTLYLDRDSSDITFFVRNNTRSVLSDTHTPQQIHIIESAASTIRRVCTYASEENGFNPHKDFHFASHAQAETCLNSLRKIQMPN